ncbi:hypothetical protein [Ascidiimonas aurantiaca]|uniref:hypothetical protein n=1 Tax=Ascidiimonas aurantiaca TaxID=1685432 RepID=UPI0030EEA04B
MKIYQNLVLYPKPRERLMAGFKLTNKTVADLNRAWEYKEEKSLEKLADKYYREFTEYRKWIAEKPTFIKNTGYKVYNKL